MFPREPWLIPATTTVDERLALAREIAIAGTRDPSVQVFAEDIRRTVGPVASLRQLAAAALAAVQRVGYRGDPPGEEQLQPCAYTLAHGGDCEDLSQLLAAVLMIFGLAVDFAWLFNPPTEAQDHESLVVHVPGDAGSPDVVAEKGPGWSWADATVTGSRLGEYPYTAAMRTRQQGRLGISVSRCAELDGRNRAVCAAAGL